LARNPHFRSFAPDAQPRGFPDRIVVRIGAPLTTRIGAVERGVSDVVTSLYLPPPTVQRLASRHASQLHADSIGATEYLFLNTRVPPFDVPAARRAVNEAVDRARLVELLGGPTVAVATCQILPPGFPGYQSYCPYGLEPSRGGAWSGPNLQRALRLVAASGTRGQRVQVWAPADHAPIALYLSGLLRLLGYRASTRIVPDAHTYYALVGDPATRAQIGWVGWAKDYTSAADFLPPLFSCAGIRADPLDTSNYSRLCDRKLDNRIGAAGRLQGWDPIAAQRAWAGVDRSIVDRAAAVPFANDLMLTLLSPRTGGYEFNPQWGVLLDELWIR
jgi:peptide/nickel transport system substrate-binding protein